MSRFSRSEHCWEAVLRGEMTDAMAGHLDECAACAEAVDAVERARRRVLDDIPLPPAGMDDRVLAVVARAREADAAVLAAPRRRWRWTLAPGFAALIALLVVLVRPAIMSEPAAAVPIEQLQASCPASGEDEGLLVAGVWHGREARRFAKVLEAFERRSGYDVGYAYETREMAARLEARIERGCAPSVALLPQPGLMEDLVRRGHIGPIDDVVGDLVQRNYTRAWRDLATIDGRLYGVWFKAANKSLVWYDRAAFRTAGVREPASWSQLMGVASRLRAAGVRPFALSAADGWVLTDWFENVFLRTAGPRMYDELAAHRIPWTHPTVKDALRRLASLFADESLFGSASAVLRTRFEESVQHVFGRRPQAAMVAEADFVRAFLPAGADPGLFPFPPIAPGSGDEAVVGGDVAVLFEDSQAGRSLMRFLATPEAALPWVDAGGFLSPNRGVEPALYPDRTARRAAEALTSAATVRFDLSDLQPPAFGARAEQGMWEIFPHLVAYPSAVDGIAARLESAASAAYACERATRGDC